MTSQARTYAICFSIGLAYFLAATLVSDVIARTTIGSEGFGSAVSKHTYYAVTQPFATALLLAPFLLLAWMAVGLVRRKTLKRGLIFLCSTCTLLAFVYFSGYQDSQHYMAQRMWTAATLAVAFLVLKSIPVLAVALVAFLLLRRDTRVEP